MPHLKLTLDNIKEIDLGRMSKTLTMLLTRAAKDCMDRPHEPKARTVSLEFAMVPVPMTRTDGSPLEGCEEVHVQIQFPTKTPVYRSKEMSMGLKADGTVFFNPDSLNNIKQATFIDEDDAESR